MASGHVGKIHELKWDYPLTVDEIEILKETGVAWCNERLFSFLCDMALAQVENLISIKDKTMDQNFLDVMRALAVWLDHQSHTEDCGSGMIVQFERYKIPCTCGLADLKTVVERIIA